MRVLLIVIAVCAGLLLAFTTVRHHSLAGIIAKQVVENTAREVAARPVDHRHTLFSGVLFEHIRQASLVAAHAEASGSSTYELVAMSPCNPRIQHCR